MKRVKAIIKRYIARKYALLYFALGAWIFLYLVYITTRTAPFNTPGFYLESARQLAANGFVPPAALKGFSLQGLPFAYPPLGIYAYALGGQILGDLQAAALYIPGLLLPLQAIAGYVFMKTWGRSEAASQWTAVVLLLLPHMFHHTMYGDGLTSGLAGLFLLVSWIFAVGPGKTGSTKNMILGGFFSGLSLLSHPAIGAFSCLTFAILFISQNRINLAGLIPLLTAGAAAMIPSLLWLIPVILQHGITPLKASLLDNKSSLYILRNPGEFLYYLYKKHTGTRETPALLFLPFPLSLLYNLVAGPRVLFLLLLAGLLVYKGHPSVTVYPIAASLGIFFDKVLLPAFGWQESQPNRQKIMGGSWWIPTAIILLALLGLNLDAALQPAYEPGEKAIYQWIRTRTDAEASFIMEGKAENVVYLGERTILLPVLGGEWMYSEIYGNKHIENDNIKQRLFNCRRLSCLEGIRNQYSLQADFIVYRVSDSGEDVWIERLTNSPGYRMAFQAGSFVIVQVGK